LTHTYSFPTRRSSDLGTRSVAFANRPRVTDVRTFTVSEDDDGIRLDRWFKRHLPEVSFNVVSRWARTGQLRLAGKRAVPGDRVEDRKSTRLNSSHRTI